MPRATCRCGQVLEVPINGPERVICPTCAAKIRVRRPSPKIGRGDGFIRFSCDCGRKLKARVVAGAPMPVAGKCPDCGAVVPIPEVEPEPSSSAEVRASYVPPDHETPTEELSTADMAALEAWAQSHAGTASNGSSNHRMKAHVPTVEEDDNLPKTLPLHPSQPMPKPAKKPTKVEAGLRVCPRCGKPVHLSAETCRDCGAHVPKR